MIKSFLNYPGGKYRLLKQLLPLFPSEYTNMVDMFTGSAVVATNVNDVHILAYDSNTELISLLNYIKETDINDILNGINQIIKKYKLTDTSRYGYDYYGLSSQKGLSSYNKTGFNKLREDYNNSNIRGINKYIYLYALIIFGFNNQMRFNNKGMFNNPTGKRDFNRQMKTKLIDFKNTVKQKDITFINSDFRLIDSNIPDAFYYADPPYLITNAVYNSAMGGWTELDEVDLYKKLDEIDLVRNKFAFSNVFYSKGKKNNLLIDWSKNYHIHHLNFDYSNSNYQTSGKGETDEVLITNY